MQRIDISLDCYKIVTNQAANNIFQIRLETCLARHLRASHFWCSLSQLIFDLLKSAKAGLLRAFTLAKT